MNNINIIFDNDLIREAVYMWRQNKENALHKYGPIESWNVLTNMSCLFSSMDDFNEDIRQWNVGNVTNMYQMFYNTNTFNQPIGCWDVSNVNEMGCMFDHASSFN